MKFFATQQFGSFRWLIERNERNDVRKDSPIGALRPLKYYFTLFNNLCYYLCYYIILVSLILILIERIVPSATQRSNLGNS